MSATPMQPLADAPRATLAAVGGVVFDVDDTVTRVGRLQPEAFDAMWRLHAAGITLVALTGRPLGWADVIARHWPVALAVGENGAGWTWVDDAGRDHHGYFHPDAERVAHGAMLDRIRARVAAEMPELRFATDQPHRRCDLAWDVGEHERVPTERVDALMALIESEGARSLVSSVHAHAMPGAWDKAQGAARAVRAVLGVDLAAERDRWLFVGDSGNDRDAFAWFTLSVGVANVRDHLHRLPTPPRWVTAAERGAGFAELAGALLAAR